MVESIYYLVQSYLFLMMVYGILVYIENIGFHIMVKSSNHVYNESCKSDKVFIMIMIVCMLIIRFGYLL